MTSDEHVDVGGYGNGSCFHTLHLCRGWAQLANSNMWLILSAWNLHPHLVIHQQFISVAPFILPLRKSGLRFGNVVSFQLQSRKSGVQWVSHTNHHRSSYLSCRNSLNLRCNYEKHPDHWISYQDDSYQDWWFCFFFNDHFFFYCGQ